GRSPDHEPSAPTCCCRSSADRPPYTDITPAIGSTRMSSLAPALTWAIASMTVDPAPHEGASGSEPIPFDASHVEHHRLKVELGPPRHTGAGLSAESARLPQGPTNAPRGTCAVHAPSRPLR